MKRIIQTALIAAFALTLGAGLALADGAASAKNRQIRQQKRIAHGVHNGSLTQGETARLQRNAAQIHRSTKRDRIDGGVFTPAERSKAQNKLNRQSRAIARQKHDGQNR